MLGRMSGTRYTPRGMLEALVGIPTVSCDSNLRLIEFVAEYLRGYGVDPTLVVSDCGQKANLYASIGPNVPGGVVLSGHTDVVPVAGQDWSSDPFRLCERGGRLYGRGTCDMKGFIAIALALVPEMGQLRQPIHLALSYDEEVGCLGAPRLIDAMTAGLPAPRAVIVGEPTSMQVVTAHKSMFIFETQVNGFEAHSSKQNLGVPAVMVAGRLVNWLAERQDSNRRLARPDCPFEPAYSTLHCGVIQGGTAQNITARRCRFVTDIRTLPDEDPMTFFTELERYAREELEPGMREVHPGTGIEFDICANVPGLCASDDEPAVVLAKQLTGQNRTESVSYGTEAGQFQQAGLSVAICGPGSIDQAHQPDEFISIDQFEQGIAFQRRLIAHLSS